MEYYTFLLTMYGSLVGSLLITMPLTGTLVRLRANFNPKSIRLDDEGNVDTQRPATSFFGMFARVKRLEVNTSCRHSRKLAEYARTTGMERIVQGFPCVHQIFTPTD